MMASIAHHFIKLVAEHPKYIPEMNLNVVHQTLGQVERFKREIHRTTHDKHEKVYFTKNLKPEKLLDMATIIDAMARIGVEEHQGIYDEFLGLVIDLLDSVFYAQKHRRKMHFGKYKALFALISGELKRDVNHQPGQVLFTNQGELFLRTAPPQTETEIK
jgi:hypothetical protein